MHISVLSLFVDLYKKFISTSIISRAIEKNIININLINLFDYANIENGFKSRIDGAVFGHDSGMLLRPDIVEKAILSQENSYKKAYRIFFSPKGQKLDQNLIKEIILNIKKNNDHLMLVPSRYEGMDTRLEEKYADLILSIGDYVLMGGDLPAMILIEGVTRLLPGVVSSYQSIEKDSFFGPFVDYPSYTEPVIWNGLKVPDILRSGNHKAIENWQREKAIESTVFNHFEWMRNNISREQDIQDAIKYIPSHYAVLMHDQVFLESNKVGTSSVTSLDIHDIARSATTYGLKKYFIVTPLEDQQRIISKLLNFWLTEKGISYNMSRHQAIKNVVICSNISEVLENIKNLENKEPLLIATTAKSSSIEGKGNRITFHDQSKVWKSKRPVLFVFGTARGLSDNILNICDYIIEPIRGFSNYNHLSVRSAAAIIFDRWLGINPRRINKNI